MKDLSDRILDAFPSGTYSLTALLRLMDIVETDTVPSAAVECTEQPRLLINPSFVAAHADTPPKLLMLVMHELHHVLLGHTTLFPCMTRVQNFVFDAVINGVISRMFPRTEHLAFLRDYYAEELFPNCLLAPPPGWPRDPVPASALKALPPKLRDRAHAVHLALYSETGASYREVYAMLPKLLVILISGDAKTLDERIASIPLLGEHEDGRQGTGLQRVSPLLFDVVRSAVEKWPQPPDPIQGRSLADIIDRGAVTPRRHPTNRQRLRRLLYRVAGLHGDGARRRHRLANTPATTPIPTLARRSLVLRALGHEPLLHPGTMPWRRPGPTGERVHVYLDVSGSMDHVLDSLYGAILDCKDQVAPRLHEFSTKVVDVTLDDIRTGRRETTGGTDIACVAEHMARHRVRRAVILTDGWVGQPSGEHHHILAKARVAVAFVGDGINEDDLAAVARHTCVLTEGEAR